MKLTVTVSRSQACAESHGLQEGSRTFTVDGDEPWVQFTYGEMRSQDGNWQIGAWKNDHFYTQDGEPWSDLVVGFCGVDA